ncbi:MAG: tRNA uridine-5-carboxymethylaminomethyl(34) synthesis enzyme MnmG [Candidatus Marinimicrobia bacterium]|nr:tRNA uridine-5-carboxymethylaminomethyl(34) synthesis enzyme MnmG [Candidatus Neomarinimicrobiota bacterium]
MPRQTGRQWDVVVAGGGHAGIEAALAAAKMGARTLLVTLDPEAIGRMSCNPAIGGLAKGHLVREIDALGGEMGLAADRNGIQFKTLNTRKGRAVWSPRAQIDKRTYAADVSAVVRHQQNLTIDTGEVTGLRTDGGAVTGVTLKSGAVIPCRTAILTCGTFVNGLIHIGNKQFKAGRLGERRSEGITESLRALGLRAGRLKTGTPPRLHRDSIDWSQTALALGDEQPVPFSFRTPLPFEPANEPCHLTYTSAAGHEIIAENLHLSPMYTGVIEGVGPRYCPSIEDKVVRFADRDRHQLFLEPEWHDAHQIYVNGFSTSLPEEVQLAALRESSGLAEVRFIRPGYAIEYDYFLPNQLQATLESKDIAGLFLAGQMNGTSGYEEAAAQGLMAGINAGAAVNGMQPLVLGRDEAYIGVMIDDLITKSTLEPYRMFTSRAEYRLLLRPDNADLRLSQKGIDYGLLGSGDLERLERRRGEIGHIKATVQQLRVSLPDSGDERIPAAQLLKRPEILLADLLPEAGESGAVYAAANLFTAETDMKYAGYIERQTRQAEALKRLESTAIDPGFDVSTVTAMRPEAREKIAAIRPETLGQASRISGVNPPDIALLSIHLQRWYVSRETFS